MLPDIWEFHVLLEMLKVESTSFKRYRNISSNFELSFPFLNYGFKYTVTLATQREMSFHENILYDMSTNTLESCGNKILKRVPAWLFRILAALTL